MVDSVEQVAEIECRKIFEKKFRGNSEHSEVIWEYQPLVLREYASECFKAGYKRALVDRMREKTFDNEDAKLNRLVKAMEKKKVG